MFDYGYIIAIVFVIVYYFLFEYVMLDSKIKQREKKINNEAIYFFEVLTLSLQTGRNLAEAIEITVNSVDGELSLEFKEALRETGFGKSLTESLNDMQKRIPSDSINNIILALTQANIYGSSIISTMYNQIDYLREKRKMEIKAQISKIPTKISVISVFFFIPLVLLIISYEYLSGLTEIYTIAGLVFIIPVHATVIIFDFSIVPQLTITAGIGYKNVPGFHITLDIKSFLLLYIKIHY